MLPLPERERALERLARLVAPTRELEHGDEVFVRQPLEPDVVGLGLAVATAVRASVTACSSSPRSASKSASTAGPSPASDARGGRLAPPEQGLRLVEAAEVAEIAREATS